MPKARDYHLHEEQLAEIEKAIRHDQRPEGRQRSTVIRLLHLGHKPGEIAQMQAVSIPTVYVAEFLTRMRRMVVDFGVGRVLTATICSPAVAVCRPNLMMRTKTAKLKVAPAALSA